jgi:hypothetical protein
MIEQILTVARQAGQIDWPGAVMLGVFFLVVAAVIIVVTLKG